MKLIHEQLRDSSVRAPWRIALIADGDTLTFKDLDRQSDRFAAALQRCGVRRGDRVALYLENCAELVVALFGVLKAGAVMVAIDRGTKTAKLAYVLNDCGVAALVADGAAREVAAALEDSPSVHSRFLVGEPRTELPEGIDFGSVVHAPHGQPRDTEVIDSDLCAILYTSGSTGEPKGVMLTHHNAANSSGAIAEYLENTPDDVVLCLLPLSFGYGLFQVFVAAVVGHTVVLERSFAYPYDVLRRMDRYRVTGLPAVPTVFARLLAMAPFDGLDLSALRYITNAAAALPNEHVRRLREALPQVRIFCMYGQTECTRVCFLDPDEVDARTGSVGKAIPNSEVFVVDQEGRRLAPGKVGELVVRGANVMRGYWGRPEATRQALRPGPVPGEVVLYTGDLFRIDAEGYLHFVARKDDVFKCRGEKVSPRAVEDVLYALEGVVEAAVIGVPDPIDGHAVKALVVLREGPPGNSARAAARLRAHCRKHLEPHLVPKHFGFFTALPKTSSGKIRRAALVALAAAS